VSEEREQFEAWLAVMDQRLRDFERELPPAVASRLDGSADSLDALESWLLDRYDSPESMRADGEWGRVNGASRYLGEVIRRELGGEWDIELDKPDSVVARVPIIRRAGTAGTTPIAPIFELSAATDRRTGRYLRDGIERLRPPG
jgi:hypothetical protein